MIDSVTILSKTGVIVYHYTNNNDADATNHAMSTGTAPLSPNEVTPSLQTTLNAFLSSHLQSPTQKRIRIPIAAMSAKKISSSNLDQLQQQQQQQQQAYIISEWTSNENYMIVVLYSHVVLEQNGGGVGMSWIQNSFLKDLMEEFMLFATHVGSDKGSGEEKKDKRRDNVYRIISKNCNLFNGTLVALYKRCESKGRMDKKMNNYSTISQVGDDINTGANGVTSSNTASSSTKTKKKKGKEDRVWHDSEQKVTSKTMAKLDRSKKDESSNDINANDDPMFISESSPALIEARAAYLPADNEVPSWEQEEVLNDNDDDENNSGSDNGGSGWGSSLKGMMDQFSGKVLTDNDLDAPLEDMQKMLTSKNVAGEIAQDICLTVRKKLVGKRMASFTRVKTAVRQALEVAIEKILRPGRGRGGGEEVDLLRNVVSKRESGMVGKLFGGSNTKSSDGKRPYVIVMGKSTTIYLIFNMMCP